jgi:hypothetical protein
VTRYVADLQNTYLDMLSCVETKLSGEVEVDGTYLGGPKSVKKGAGGRSMGKQRTKEKTLIIAQQRRSQRFAVLQTDRHEHCLAADELAEVNIEPGPGTTLFTDGGIP